MTIATCSDWPRVNGAAAMPTPSATMPPTLSPVDSRSKAPCPDVSLLCSPVGTPILLSATRNRIRPAGYLFSARNSSMTPLPVELVYSSRFALASSPSVTSIRMNVEAPPFFLPMNSRSWVSFALTLETWTPVTGIFSPSTLPPSRSMYLSYFSSDFMSASPRMVWKYDVAHAREDRRDEPVRVGDRAHRRQPPPDQRLGGRRRLIAVLLEVELDVRAAGRGADLAELRLDRGDDGLLERGQNSVLSIWPGASGGASASSCCGGAPAATCAPTWSACCSAGLLASPTSTLRCGCAVLPRCWAT